MPPTVNARRCRRLFETARDIAAFRGEGRAFAPAFYAALAGLAYALSQAGGFGAYLAPTVALFCALIILSLFDARYLVIPDGPIYALALTGAAIVLLGDMRAAPDRVAAAIIGGGALWAVATIYERLRGAPGLGLGDARLFAVAGLWVGLEGLASCLLYGVVSALVGVVVSACGAGAANARQPFPFGPHLSLGLWLCWVVGPLQPG